MQTNRSSNAFLTGKQMAADFARARGQQNNYNRSRLTYAETFESRTQRLCIKMVELLTAKPRILQLVREFERRGPAKGQDFWQQMLDVMGISCDTPQHQIAHIPTKGPHNHSGKSSAWLGGRLVARAYDWSETIRLSHSDPFHLDRH